MKRTIYIFTIFLIFVSCNKNNSEVEWNEIRNTRSIEQYENYLVNHSQTKYIVEIIDSLRIFWKRFAIEHWHYDCLGNCLTLIINKNGQVLFENEPIKENDLKEKIKYSISNPEDLENLPEKEIVKIEDLGEFTVSQGVIDIVTDEELNTDKYAEIIELVKESFTEMRNEYSLLLFNKTFEKLILDQKQDIETIVPMRIRFERFGSKQFEIPPQPPDSIINMIKNE